MVPNSTFRTALRCLAHPATLFSIGVLLLNDHLLKAVTPSWATGKASDFAGLFFFPFLLAALLGLLSGAMWFFTPAAAGRVAFGMTALWFVAAKATPWGHALTTQAVATVLGHPVLITPDPTDLIALIMLWPAWRLWRAEAARPKREIISRLRWPALAAAVIATVATSPVPPPEMVQRVLVDGGELYAVTWRGTLSTVSNTPLVYVTEDRGRSWSVVASADAPRLAPALAATPPHKTVIDPRDPQTLFRSGNETIETSSDGGQTWRTAWQVPAGRRQFMARYGSQAGGPVLLGPYDLTFAPDNSGTLIVALGTEGVLVRDPTGVWTRYAVGRTTPTPFAATDARRLLSILSFPEGLVLGIAALVVSALLGFLAWLTVSSAFRRAHGPDDMKRARWLTPVLFIASVLLFLIPTALRVLLPFVTDEWVRIISTVSALAFPCGLILLLVVLPIATWTQTCRLAHDKRAAGRALGSWLATTVGLPVIGGAPFVLWGLGVAPWYALALCGALVLALVIIVMGARMVLYHSRAASAGYLTERS